MSLEGSCHCGAAGWHMNTTPDSALQCNCTVCRRYAPLWAYGDAGKNVMLFGDTAFYQPGEGLEFHRCAHCGCLVCWKAIDPGEQGFHRVRINLRLAEPKQIAQLRLDYFDGLTHWVKNENTGKIVADIL